jgi:hypothetical protein
MQIASASKEEPFYLGACRFYIRNKRGCLSDFLAVSTLIKQQIPFIIRVKQNFLFEIGEDGTSPIGRLRKRLSLKKSGQRFYQVMGSFSSRFDRTEEGL